MFMADVETPTAPQAPVSRGCVTAVVEDPGGGAVDGLEPGTDHALQRLELETR